MFADNLLIARNLVRVRTVIAASVRVSLDVLQPYTAADFPPEGVAALVGAKLPLLSAALSTSGSFALESSFRVSEAQPLIGYNCLCPSGTGFAPKRQFPPVLFDGSTVARNWTCSAAILHLQTIGDGDRTYPNGCSAFRDELSRTTGETALKELLEYFLTSHCCAPDEPDAGCAVCDSGIARDGGTVVPERYRTSQEGLRTCFDVQGRGYANLARAGAFRERSDDVGCGSLRSAWDSPSNRAVTHVERLVLERRCCVPPEAPRDDDDESDSIAEVTAEIARQLPLGTVIGIAIVRAAPRRPVRPAHAARARAPPAHRHTPTCHGSPRAGLRAARALLRDGRVRAAAPPGAGRAAMAVVPQGPCVSTCVRRFEPRATRGARADGVRRGRGRRTRAAGPAPALLAARPVVGHARLGGTRRAQPGGPAAAAATSRRCRVGGGARRCRGSRAWSCCFVRRERQLRVGRETASPSARTDHDCPARLEPAARAARAAARAAFRGRARHGGARAADGGGGSRDARRVHRARLVGRDAAWRVGPLRATATVRAAALHLRSHRLIATSWHRAGSRHRAADTRVAHSCRRAARAAGAARAQRGAAAPARAGWRGQRVAPFLRLRVEGVPRRCDWCTDGSLRVPGRGRFERGFRPAGRRWRCANLAASAAASAAGRRSSAGGRRVCLRGRGARGLNQTRCKAYLLCDSELRGALLCRSYA